MTDATAQLMATFTATPGAVTLGNSDDLVRMVRNVLDNALRHADHKVLITLTAAPRRAAPGTGKPDAAPPGTVRIAIIDDGPGIPADERERVFDRFVRLDASRERASGSTGLGLAIAKEIATAHGGRITIHDAPGGGACVEITLPDAHGASRAAA